MPRGTGHKVATLADVAAAVGLSPAAVSLALRGKPGVSETTRERIVEASRSLGYRPLSHTTRHHQGPLTVTLVIRALHGDSPGANRFYGPVLAGVEERCRRLHIRSDARHHAGRPVQPPHRGAALRHRPAERRADLRWRSLRQRHRARSWRGPYRPSWSMRTPRTGSSTRSRRTTSWAAGPRSSISSSHGHRNIAILGTEPDAFPSILQRRRGYEQAMAEAGLTARYIDAPYYEHESRRRRRPSATCARNPSVTAIFCANDLVAITFIQAAQQAGISVPEQGLGRRLRRHRPGELHLAVPDDYGGRQGRDGPTRRHPACAPARCGRGVRHLHARPAAAHRARIRPDDRAVSAVTGETADASRTNRNRFMQSTEHDDRLSTKGSR